MPNTNKNYPIFIGYDPRESIAYQVCKFSIERRTSYPVDIYPLHQQELREAGLYWRPSFTEGLSGQPVDAIDGRPYSSEFTFTRFLVGELAKKRGYYDFALFMDPDMLVLSDIKKMLDLRDPASYDIMCVKHDFEGTTKIKLDNKRQEPYPRKLWSSLFMMNLQAQDYRITPEQVSTWRGRDLHGFKGCPDELIGAIPESWNFIPGHSEARVDEPDLVHYSEVSPWFEGQQDCAYGDLWWAELEAYKEHIHLTKKKEIFW